MDGLNVYGERREPLSTKREFVRGGALFFTMTSSWMWNETCWLSFGGLRGLCFWGLCFRGLNFPGLCFRGLSSRGLCFWDFHMHLTLQPLHNSENLPIAEKGPYENISIPSIRSYRSLSLSDFGIGVFEVSAFSWSEVWVFETPPRKRNVKCCIQSHHGDMKRSWSPTGSKKTLVITFSKS